MLIPRIFTPRFKKGKFRVEVRFGQEKGSKLVGKFEGNKDKILRGIIKNLFFGEYPGDKIFKYFEREFAGLLIKNARQIPAKAKDKKTYTFDGVSEEIILQTIKKKYELRKKVAN